MAYMLPLDPWQHFVDRLAQISATGVPIAADRLIVTAPSLPVSIPPTYTPGSLISKRAVRLGFLFVVEVVRATNRVATCCCQHGLSARLSSPQRALFQVGTDLFGVAMA